MKTIYKYRLPFMETATVEMPVGAKIIRADGLEGALWLWAIVDTEVPTETRTFHLFKTGGKMPQDILEFEYIGCGAIFVQMELMMYIFERKTETKQADDWIQHFNDERPVPRHTRIVARLADGREESGFAWEFRWDGDGGNTGDILAYKVIE